MPQPYSNAFVFTQFDKAIFGMDTILDLFRPFVISDLGPLMAHRYNDVNETYWLIVQELRHVAMSLIEKKSFVTH
ncbi:unnamed protein product [Arctia plantaginis]|nr:unnamed protein product [Arctia plantaginis]